MENFLCLSTRYYESRDLCDWDSWSPISGCLASEIKVVPLEGSMEKSAWGCFLSVRWLADQVLVFFNLCMHHFSLYLHHCMAFSLHASNFPLCVSHGEASGLDHLQRSFQSGSCAWGQELRVSSSLEETQSNLYRVRDHEGHEEPVKKLQDKQVKQGVVYKPQISPGTLPISKGLEPASGTAC